MKISNVVRNTFDYAIFLAALFVMFVGVFYFRCMLDGTQQYFWLILWESKSSKLVLAGLAMMLVSFFLGHVTADQSRDEQEQTK